MQRRSDILLSCIFLFYFLQVRAEQVHFSESHNVLDSKFSGYVHHLMDIWGVKGISMAVVKPDHEVEFGAWGIRTEDGEPMTPEVSGR